MVVRPMQPADEPAAKALFAMGMQETIVRGLRAELLRPAPARLAIGIAALAAAAALVPYALPRATPLVSCALAGALLAGVWGALVMAVPVHIARQYVGRSLADDMASPVGHYLGAKGACAWVAVDEYSGEIAGMVAVESPSGSGEPGSGWRWSEGDAELRRMCVARWARRSGVATALFDELCQFCEHAGYRRVVLVTSTLQGAAHDYLYPMLGFAILHQQPLFGRVVSTCFARPIRPEEGHTEGGAGRHE
jgi:GNAT superfamily N-acetyltransferase